MPALDGVRALAVIAVMGYHFGVSHMGGGLLGVAVFFTLSGFLITELLLNTFERTGSLELGWFWLRRARRLLPALAVVLVTVVLVTAVTDRPMLSARRDEAVAAALYVSNWFTIGNGVSYFDRIAGPGPLDHLWSLAIEEQFYLFWPLILLLLLRVTGRRRIPVARVTVGVAAVCFVLLALWAQPGFDNTRAYEGTDTRAGELLIGAALALYYRPAIRQLRVGWRGRAVIEITAIGSLATIGWLVLTTTQYSLWVYRGGTLVLALASAALLAAVVHPVSLVGKVLGIGSLRWLGERSYGVYLWHMPVAAFAPQSLFGEYSVRRVVFQVGAHPRSRVVVLDISRGPDSTVWVCRCVQEARF